MGKKKYNFLLRVAIDKILHKYFGDNANTKRGQRAMEELGDLIIEEEKLLEKKIEEVKMGVVYVGGVDGHPLGGPPTPLEKIKKYRLEDVVDKLNEIIDYINENKDNREDD